MLEPLQTADTLEGQIEELHTVIEARATPPVTLVGSSWGAMLGYLFAARHPEHVRKLIMIGSAVFDESSSASIKATRLARLSSEHQPEAHALIERQSRAGENHDAILARLAELFTLSDCFDPIMTDLEVIEVQHAINQSVWRDAKALRGSGEMLALGRAIACPVVAIHGAYDPHPRAGIEGPLSSVLRDFRFIELEECGHYPWIERRARERFFTLLREELA